MQLFFNLVRLGNIVVCILNFFCLLDLFVAFSITSAGQAVVTQVARLNFCECIMVGVARVPRVDFALLDAL